MPLQEVAIEILSDQCPPRKGHAFLVAEVTNEFGNQPGQIGRTRASGRSFLLPVILVLVIPVATAPALWRLQGEVVCLPLPSGLSRQVFEEFAEKALARLRDKEPHSVEQDRIGRIGGGCVFQVSKIVSASLLGERRDAPGNDVCAGFHPRPGDSQSLHEDRQLTVIAQDFGSTVEDVDVAALGVASSRANSGTTSERPSARAFRKHQEI